MSGQQATSASDIYALGMVAYECLAGAPPFTGTALEVAVAHRDRPLPALPPSITADVSAFVMRLTAKGPAYRPGSAAEVTVWAGLLRDGFGRAASPICLPPGPSAGAGRSRPRATLAFACVALAAVIVLALASVIGFASTAHPLSVPSSAPSRQSHGSGVAAQRASSPETGPGWQPAESPAAVAAARPARKHGHGHGDGHGHGRGDGHGDGNGNGQGNGDGNAQVVSASD